MRRSSLYLAAFHLLALNRVLMTFVEGYALTCAVLPCPRIMLCYNCSKLRPDAALSLVALLTFWRCF